MEVPKSAECLDSMKVVTSNKFITACGLEKVSLKARKLLYIAISQCKKTDTEFFMYSLPVREFAEMMDIDSSNVYRTADSITDELMKGFLRVDNGRKFSKYSLFSKVEYEEDGNITFKINRDMTDFFLGLKKNFTQPLLNDFLKMKSTYSMSIWHLMQREMLSKKPSVTNEITFDISLEELREVTGTQEKFKQIIEFRRKVLDKAIREIRENCSVDVSYTYIKKGRSIVGFHFKAISLYHISEDDIPQEKKDRIKWFNLKMKAQEKPLTKAEREEFNRLAAILGEDQVEG